jgi:hypothetical protein
MMDDVVPTGEPVDKLMAGRWQLHPACAAWPAMTDVELKELADDIRRNGLCESVTTTPDGLLLDGRNRTLACELVHVVPTFVTYHGDPWLFSLSKNKHRRHLATDQVAMVAARLATLSQGGDRRSEDFKTSSEGLKVAEVAKAAGVPKTAIESAKAVLRHGAPEEVEAVRAGRAPLRRTVDAIRTRTREAASRPCPKTSAAVFDELAANLRRRFAGRGWHDVAKAARAIGCARSAMENALSRLGEAVEMNPDNTRFQVRDELEIAKDRNGKRAAIYVELQQVRDQLAAKDARIAELEQLLRARDVEIAALKMRLGEDQLSHAPTIN